MGVGVINCMSVGVGTQVQESGRYQFMGVGVINCMSVGVGTQVQESINVVCVSLCVVVVVVVVVLVVIKLT